MKKYFLILPTILLFLQAGLFAKNAEPIKIFLIEGKGGNGLKDLTAFKVSQALGLAAEFSSKYKCANFDTRDSVIRLIESKGQKANAIAIKRELGADYGVFITVSALGDLIRADVDLRSGDSMNISVKAHGYEMIRYKNIDDNAPVYDPAMLKAIMKAMAVALKDSSMYAKAKGKFAVVPTSLLAVCGFEYIDNPQIKPVWKMTADKVEGSYFICEKIVEKGSKCKNFTVMNTATRDSIFALYRYYLADNNKVVTTSELGMLRSLGCEYIISGSVERNTAGLSLKLFLIDIKQGMTNPVKTAEGSILEEDLDQWERLIEKLTGELLDIEN